MNSNLHFTQEKSNLVDFFLTLPLLLNDCTDWWLLSLAMGVKLYSAEEDEEIRGILLETSHVIEEPCRMEREKRRRKIFA